MYYVLCIIDDRKKGAMAYCVHRSLGEGATAQGRKGEEMYYVL